jgi:hypothetical protein
MSIYKSDVGEWRRKLEQLKFTLPDVSRAFQIRVSTFIVPNTIQVYKKSKDDIRHDAGKPTPSVATPTVPTGS